MSLDDHTIIFSTEKSKHYHAPICSGELLCAYIYNRLIYYHWFECRDYVMSFIDHMSLDDHAIIFITDHKLKKVLSGSVHWATANRVVYN
jgi:hypothetical protein